jgi:hypothetical protein
MIRMPDTPAVPPVPPVPPGPEADLSAAAVVPPPPPPAVPESAVPNPYAQPGYAPPAYGQPGSPPAPSPYGDVPRTNPLAIVSLVLSLVAVFVWFLGSLGAVICGHIALNQIKRTGESGRGLALAGVIIGYVGLGLTVLIGLAYAILFAVVVSSSNSGNF